jgi:hypothetical protein
LKTLDDRRTDNSRLTFTPQPADSGWRQAGPQDARRQGTQNDSSIGVATGCNSSSCQPLPRLLA